MIRDANRAAASIVAKLSREIGREVTAADLWQLVRSLDAAKILVTERHEAVALRGALTAIAQRLSVRHAGEDKSRPRSLARLVEQVPWTRRR